MNDFRGQNLRYLPIIRGSGSSTAIFLSYAKVSLTFCLPPKAQPICTYSLHWSTSFTTSEQAGSPSELGYLPLDWHTFAR